MLSHIGFLADLRRLLLKSTDDLPMNSWKSKNRTMGFEPMISIKRYLDGATEDVLVEDEECTRESFKALVSAYKSGLASMGSAGFNACPVFGAELQKDLAQLHDNLPSSPTLPGIRATESEVSELLQNWAKKTAQHYEEKAGEVKDLLLVMARTAEALGHKDEHFAEQLQAVTTQLETIATLEDVSRIRASIHESSRELKASAARMVAETAAVIKHLQVEVSTYQTKLERAEHIASCDCLTGVGSRRWIEARIQRRIEDNEPFSIVMIDIEDFQRVNDEHGNLVGDMLLKEFARELRGACRFSDLVARWGSDEFLVLLDSTGTEARGQMARLHSWISGPYQVPARPGQLSVRLDATLGLAEFQPGDNLYALLERADADLSSHRKLAQERKTA